MKKEYPDFTIEDNQITIKDHIKASKPITGTKFGAITGDNPYSSPFVAFMDMYRFSMPFRMTIEMRKGIEFEPVIIRAINQISEKVFKNFTTAPYYDFDTKSEPGNKYNGKLDGWNKEEKIVLEIKVTKNKNLEKWIVDKPPKYYILQMLLYGMLTDAKEVWLGAYFLESGDYNVKTPSSIDPAKLRVWKYKLDDKSKEFLETKLNVTKDFFKNNIEKRISPKFEISKQCDRDLLDFLDITY